MVRTLHLLRGKRPSRSAKSTAIEINNILARRRFRPSAGVGVKIIKSSKNKNFKVKILLKKPKKVDVKKGGVVIRSMIIRRKSNFPGKRNYLYG